MNEPLKSIVVYFNTIDYPNVYIARIFHNDKPTNQTLGPTDTLDELRSLIPYGLYRLDRNEQDDKVIVEVWI